MMRELSRASAPGRLYVSTIFEDSAQMRTYQQKTAETKHDWYIVDAAGQRLGTLAVRIARALSGKHKPTWTPNIDNGDHVIVINADKVELGGNKWDQKVYYRHSGYPGGLRTQTAREIQDKHPGRIIEKAVRGMLPTNRMRDEQLRRLSVYAGESHPHNAQTPQELF
jgi:large subunit ribosomal protein L13